ncbi:hypothetical protein BpHYR1_047704 [Brachionus plicatilis]|uniref:Uncharacterized protein n=1 Tax=Brachionus plicatilis TaxID=10195 RepID=A0A3M7RYQ8_BRAPC|nr:hypothetical protein BpHYR1_047704 [Brachionus plicatilis]
MVILGLNQYRIVLVLRLLFSFNCREIFLNKTRDIELPQFVFLISGSENSTSSFGKATISFSSRPFKS